MTEEKKEPVTLSCGWAVGHSTLSDDTCGVMVYVLNAPLSLTYDDAEAMAVALLTAAKNAKKEQAA